MTGGAPDEEGQVINVGVGLHDVGDGVVRVVAVLPPIYRKACEKIAGNVGEEVVELAVRGEVVMAQVVAEPAELLKAEADEHRAKQPVT